ncbi:MAG: ketol-acid reductoisomerase [Candidatus Firestonebacteria bacterium]
MVKAYYDKDGDLKLLKGKTIGIIGYGNQGHAQAQNLRDSGIDVIICELPGTKAYDDAKKDKFKVVTADEMAQKADVVQILTQDDLQAKIYKDSFAKYMKKGKTLVFSHGFNIHFTQIIPPAEVDVIMIAPKGPGHLVRTQYEAGRGVPALIAIFQDASGKAKQTALAYAKGIGATKAGVLETTFKEETETDLFGEQAVLCGGASALVKAGFETLVDAGYQPEIAYFECLHELKLICDLMYEYGIQGMRNRVSTTARYGDLMVGPRIVTDETKKEMKKVLTEIQNGTFANQWLVENLVNRPVFNALMKKDDGLLVEKVGKELRSMMDWIKK